MNIDKFEVDLINHKFSLEKALEEQGYLLSDFYDAMNSYPELADRLSKLEERLLTQVKLHIYHSALAGDKSTAGEFNAQKIVVEKLIKREVQVDTEQIVMEMPTEDGTLVNIPI
jgi:hypothetical protein